MIDGIIDYDHISFCNPMIMKVNKYDMKNINQEILNKKQNESLLKDIQYSIINNSILNIEKNDNIKSSKFKNSNKIKKNLILRKQTNSSPKNSFSPLGKFIHHKHKGNKTKLCIK